MSAGSGAGATPLYVVRKNSGMSANDVTHGSVTTPVMPALHLAAYRAWLRAADRPATTIELRVYHVLRLARDLPDPLALSTDDLIAWLSTKPWATETRRSYRASLRSYFRWAHMVGLIEHDPTAALPLIRPRVGVPRPAAEDAISRALRTAEPRVQLMIRLGAEAGLRRGEIAQVHTDDLRRDLSGWSLLVHGKGRRERQVPLLEHTARRIHEQPHGWAFPSPAGGHLTPAHVGRLVSAALGNGTTSHQLRHRFATRAYAVDHDLLAVKQLLGHAKSETTEVYTQIPASRARWLVESAA